MTKNSLSKIFKSIILCLSVLCLFCACAFAVACGGDSDTDSGETTPTYTYNETDSEIISNRFFKYGTHDKTNDDFPMSSITGWSKSADNSAASSTVTSGVISVANSSAWDKVFDNLYALEDFLTVYKTKYAADLEGKTDDEKKEFIKTQLSNPDKHAGAEDDFIYMLNNFTLATDGTGTAQRLRSSSSVSVKKGEVYKVSVWVYTNILSAGGNNQGANITFSNSITSNSQADFRIDKIDTAKTWKNYTVYFFANEDYDCTFTLSLGLGYGNGNTNATQDYVMGTVFFDDVTVEKVEAADIPAAFDETETLIFGSDEPISVNPVGDNVFKYDMNFDTSEYFTDVPAMEQTVTLNAETKTVNIKNTGDTYFSVTTLATDENNYEKYMLVSFKVQNKLDKLGSTDITVNVIDKFDDTEETRKGIATFSTVDDGDDFTTCTIIVKNNFKAAGTIPPTDNERQFYIQLVIGPSDASSVTALSEFATGTVKIKDVKYSDETKADCNGYISSERYDDKTDDPNYKLFSFFNTNANATLALYAGYDEDYQKQTDGTYSLTPAKSNIGEITAHPTAVNGYDGITADHFYVKTGSDVTAINDRTALNGVNGYAGLINTKYIATYAAGDAYLTGALEGLYTEDEPIQPIVIANRVADHYGFVGTQQTVSASAYAQVTVKLKVSGANAKAYVYLVDTSNNEKDVMQFAAFTVNTEDGLKNAAIKDHTYSAADHKFMLIIDENAEVGTDKWVELNFYVATGATEKSFRVEIWNGGRDGQPETNSIGYVIINSITVTTASAFSEPTSWLSAFDSSATGPLSGATISSFGGEGNALIAYTRELTDTEKEFNKEYPDKAVSYDAKYVWANNSNTVYAVFNTIDPVEHNPYDDITPEEEGSGCSANSDPSAFWLSFSSILLAVVLVGAIAALFIKRHAAKRRANKSDAVSQYKVKSRSEAQKEINKAKTEKAKKEKAVEDAAKPENVSAQESEPAAAPEENTAENTETTESTENSDSGDETEQSGYVYGEVQDFGDMSLEMPEE
ncbi:MAG: hypothetical protein J5697_00580, partial [Clostridia bacterium]|nr:hypothetical protein [Clostridia bacterium]